MDNSENNQGTQNKGQTKNKKRTDYISWDQYFMGIALLSAKRSKDPSMQVGACIVNEEDKIVGIGYNGFPIGCHDDILPWGKDENKPLHNKNMYVCHAEMNAIVNKYSANLKNSRIYTNLFPCNECAKILIQSGIKRVVYLEDRSDPKYEASRIMFKLAGVKFEQLPATKEKIELNFDI